MSVQRAGQRVLVLGGNGLIGSALVDRLAAEGHEIAVLDRFSSGVTYQAAGVEQIIGDVTDPALLLGAMQGRDTLVHLVSASTPASADADPVTDVRVNVAGALRVLEVAAAAGVRVHFASTGGAMYGEVERPGGALETDLPEPVSPYAIGKLAIEGYLRYFRVKHGLESVVYRISNPYGPRQHAGRGQGVIPIFLDRVARGEPVTVLGDGRSTRDFVHVDDVAAMLAAAIGGAPRHELYHVGSGLGHTVEEVVELCAEATGRPVTVERLPEPATYVRRAVLDISRFVEEFGFGPTIGLREGIARTWAERAA